MADRPLTRLEDALESLLPQIAPVPGVETVPLSSALGRVLAENCTVPADVPPADNSSVDGYAVCAGDLVSGRPLPISDRIPAGAAPSPMKPGTAVRLFTGSEIPSGADAVVMQEDTRLYDEQLIVETDVTQGQNIRRRGQDLTRGDLALAAGVRLRAQELGLLASLGIAEIAVYARPRVAVLNTGDELVDPGNSLAPGQIYNSNRFMLTGLLAEAGCELVACETLKDDRQATRNALENAAQAADLIITSGGVSVGEEDHVRAVMEELGSLSLWRLAIRPGKPLAFGLLESSSGETPLLGLPGNPGSVLVTFLMVGMPLIRTLQGRPQRELLGEQLPAAFTVDKPSVRRDFLRARREHQGATRSVTVYPNQSSGVLSSACWADGLAVVPEHTTVQPGDRITYYSFDELLS